MWYYNEQEILEAPKDFVGFVYLIKNLENERYYIGRKQFWSKQRNPKTGRKEKKESDWKKYYGSHIGLKEDVKLLGPEKFKRIILRMCKTPGEQTYFEELYIYSSHALGTDQFYNDNVRAKLFGKNVRKYYAEGGFPVDISKFLG